MPRSLSALAAALVLLLGTSTGALGTGGSAHADGAGGAGRPTDPTVLAAADKLAGKLSGAGVTGDQGAAHTGRETTLLLRDLVRARHRLTGADRTAAESILARPTDPADRDGYDPAADPGRACTERVCVHWVETTADAIDPTDSDGDRTPDYAETVLRTLDLVHRAYVAAGYRPPKPDGTLGGGPQTDVYLADIGDQAIYGYCTSDERSPGDDAWAYCVLDDDYSAAQFRRGTPLGNLQVTAAHEYFHAVQFGYDYTEHRWFMEATATWVEDEVFDHVDDNAHYLPAGPLGRPALPLDWVGTGHEYGAWVFFRYLTERLPRAEGDLPTLVRDMWRRADATRGRAADQNSLEALKHTLRNRGADWRQVFARFAEAGRRPTLSYEEARANDYPRAPLAATVRLSRERRVARWHELWLDHLASSTVRFVPRPSLAGRRWRLRVRLDQAPVRRGSRAIVTVRHRHRPPTTRLVTLTRGGEGRLSVPFSRRLVRAIEVTLVNTSTRLRDDYLPQRIRGRAVR